MENLSENLSEIQKFYVGKKIFLTGGTGFLGKIFIEKLLRSCGGLDKIYLLMREKKGVAPKERLDEMLKGPLFEKMKLLTPNFMEKLVVVNGDCEKPNLGLSDEFLKVLKNEINCVFHCAATVRFDEHIRKATYINVRGVMDLLKIAKEMRCLKSFVYVSTAYSHCTKKNIDEVFYDTPVSPEKLLAIVDLFSEEQLQAITPHIIGKWPNTYVFTKGVAEDVIRNGAKGLPLGLVRPSIVVSTSKEPIGGWIDNIYGPTGVLYGAGLGLLHTLQADPEKVSDLVPADYVVNMCIATGWKVYKEFFKHHEDDDKSGTKQESKAAKEFNTTASLDKSDNQQLKLKNDNDVYLFNFVSGCEQPITWGLFNILSQKYGEKYRSSLQIWYTYFMFIKNFHIYRLSVIFFHFVPAYVVDFIARILGRKPIMVKAYNKIDKFSDVITFFAMREWYFKNDNTQTLWNMLSEEDRKNFEFSLTLHDWDSFFDSYVLGGRVYFLKDPIETIPKSRMKHKMFAVLHYLVVALSLFLLYKIILFFVNLFG